MNDSFFEAPLSHTLISFPNTPSYTYGSPSTPCPLYYSRSFDQSGRIEAEAHGEQAAELDRCLSRDWSEAIENGPFFEMPRRDFTPTGLVFDGGGRDSQSSSNYDQYTPFSQPLVYGPTTTPSGSSDSLIPSPPQPFDSTRSTDPRSYFVDTPAYSTRQSGSTLVDRTPKRFGQHFQPDSNVLPKASTLDSSRLNPGLHKRLEKIRVAPFLCNGKSEPKLDEPAAKEILGVLVPNSPRSGKSSPSIYHIFIEGKVCLICGEKRDSTTRAIRCVRKHLNHRPFQCGGQRDGCAKCGVENKYASFPYWTRDNAFHCHRIDQNLF